MLVNICQDILQYSAASLGRIENNGELVLYVSRHLLDSIRYLHHRDETRAKPDQGSPLIRKLGSVLVYFAIRGQLMEKELAESVLADYEENRRQIPTPIIMELDRKFPSTLSSTRKAIEEIAHLGQDTRYWDMPGLRKLFL